MKMASHRGTRDQEDEEVDEEYQSNVIFMHRISVFCYFIPKIHRSILNQG